MSLKSSTKPNINTDDLVESHPGALPGANPVERARFEEKCLKLYAEQKQEDEWNRRENFRVEKLKFDQDVDNLCEMFPGVDRSLVYNLLVERKGMEEVIEVLVGLDADTATPVTVANQQQGGASSSSNPGEDVKDGKKDDNEDEDNIDDDFEIIDEPKKKSDSSNTKSKDNKFTNPSDFPALTDQDGWEVANFSKLDEEMSLDKMVESPRDWAKMAERVKDVIPINVGNSNSISPGKNNMGNNRMRKGQNQNEKEGQGQNRYHDDYDEEDEDDHDEFGIRRQIASQKRGRKKFAKRMDKREGNHKGGGSVESRGSCGSGGGNVDMPPAGEEGGE